MGVDIGIAVYDKEREDEITALKHATGGFQFAPEDVKKHAPLDLDEVLGRLAVLLKDRRDFKSPTSHIEGYRGERWFNLTTCTPLDDISVRQKILKPSDLTWLIDTISTALRMCDKGTDDYSHMEHRLNFFKQLKRHNLMLYPC